MVALSEFWLLHGFLPEDKLMEVLKNIPEFSPLLSIIEEEGYFGLYKKVMERSDAESNQVLQPLVDRISPIYKTAQILTIIDGEAEINEGSTNLSFKKGDFVILISNSSYQISFPSSVIIYKATAP